MSIKSLNGFLNSIDEFWNSLIVILALVMSSKVVMFNKRFELFIIVGSKDEIFINWEEFISWYVSGRTLSYITETPVKAGAESVSEFNVIKSFILELVNVETFSQLINISSFEPTIINNSNLLLNITTLEDITNDNITIREFQNSSMEFKKPLRDLIDITVDNNTRDSLNSTSIKVYYTNEELSSGNLDESTLKFYYYNETSAEWQALSSTVNTANNFIEVSLSHLSIYGVFCDEIQSSPQQPSSGGGSSTRESQLSNDTKSKETTEVPDLIQEEIKSVTEIPVEQETPQKEDIQESLTGFSIFGIKISRIDLPSFIILVTGFILAISYSGYRLLKKRRAF